MKNSWCMLLLVMPGILGYKIFQNRIPNGDRIPHPCLPNYVWHGVGHMAKDGGGMRNSFGNDFDKNGQKWDRCLCEADSDEDGKTNGEELGDPDCEWVPGATPKITDTNKLSHPGICDPYDSAECLRINNWDVCENAAEFSCDAFNKEDVQNFTLKNSKPYEVPKDHTTYVCLLLDLPTEGDWHIIGYTPEIDNANVMHHLTMSFCPDDAVTKMNGAFDEPALCGMGGDLCEGTTVVWTVGLNGNCMPETYGLRIGEQTPYKKALFQYHYNNPEEKTGYTDQSGMRFFIEPRQRPNDKVDAFVSLLDFSIPPKQLNYEASGACTAECSQEKLGEVRYLTELLPHMHYLGRAMIVEHYRGDEKLPDLVNDNAYSYDSPVTYTFDPPVEYRPGDKIVVRCFFNSMNTDSWTYFGENTADEMCIAFLAFYPPPAFTCFAVGDEMSACANGNRNISELIPFSEACTHIGVFVRNNFADILLTLQGKCDVSGLVCQPGCQEAIDEVRQNGCMQGQYYTWTKYIFGSQQGETGKALLNMLHSCEEFEVQTAPDSGPPAGGNGLLCEAPDTTDAAMATRSSVVLVSVLSLLLMITNRFY